jgi:hypothetical protein
MKCSAVLFASLRRAPTFPVLANEFVIHQKNIVFAPMQLTMQRGDNSSKTTMIGHTMFDLEAQPRLPFGNHVDASWNFEVFCPDTCFNENAD